jgi:hypothetical protein
MKEKDALAAAASRGRCIVFFIHEFSPPERDAVDSGNGNSSKISRTATHYANPAPAKMDSADSFAIYDLDSLQSYAHLRC